MALVITAPQDSASKARLGFFRLLFAKMNRVLLPISVSLSEREQLLLDRQLLSALAERTRYWLLAIILAGAAVLKFGQYKSFFLILFWEVSLLVLILPYYPFLRKVRGLGEDATRQTIMILHSVWACWLIVISVIWLSGFWLFLPQPDGRVDFFLGQRAFVYLTLLGQVFTVLFLPASPLAVLGILVGIFSMFHFFLASNITVLPVNLLVYFYGLLIVYFSISCFVLIDQRNVRARGILLEAEHARADAERRRANHFVAAVSHDLRQPLTTLSLKLKSLMTKAHTPEMLADIQVLQQQTIAMEGMVSGSLDLSRIEAGTWRVQLREVALQHLTQKVVDDLQPEATAAGLQLELASLPYLVRTDPLALERILRNLVGNAIRYTPGRTADGQAGRILLECKVRDGLICISVVDNGIGIPKSRLSDVFAEYVQLANPERDRNKGLGLGLSIVRGLSALLGHALEVDSTEGQGSRFSILVPIAARITPELRAQMGATDSEPDLKDMVIVLVDDDQGPRHALRERLIEWGCYVVDGESADEVIMYLRDEEVPGGPHFILADYRLRNGKTGIEAIEAIRTELRRVVPAAIWSAETSHAKLQEVRDAGLELLAKPPDERALLAAIERYRPGCADPDKMGEFNM